MKKNIEDITKEIIKGTINKLIKKKKIRKKKEKVKMIYSSLKIGKNIQFDMKI